MAQSTVAANVLGTIGTILWCIQLVPQIWYNYKRKKTDGMPAAMMMLWAVSIIPFGAYAIVQEFAIPLQLQPQIFGVLALIAWGQVFYYDSKVPGLKVWSLVGGLCAFFGGVEAGLTFGIMIPYRNGITWPVILVGVVAAVLLVAGFIPTFIEIWCRRGRVLGISFVFLTVDSLGAIFSLLALAFEDTFDLLGGILYICVVTAEIGMAASHLIWRWRTRHLHTKATEMNITFDDLPEAHPYQRTEQKPPNSDADAVHG